MRHLPFSSSALALFLFLTACGSDDSTTSVPTAAVDGGGCGSLNAGAAAVSVETRAEAPPAAEGGMLLDGTYASTGGVLYVGPAGDASAQEGPLAMTVRVEGTRIEIARDGVVRAGTFSASGSTLTVTTMCPDAKVDAIDYTATSDTLRVHVKRSSGTLVETLTRQ